MLWLLVGIAIALDVVAIVGTATALAPTPALALPALGAILPMVLFWPRVARTARIVSGAVIGVFAVLGAASVGIFFVPAAVVMGVAAARTGRPSST